MRRRIDHLVLAVDDLEAASARFTERGFLVGARNRHPWGTENRLIQFRTSFLELITVAEPGLIPPHEPGVFSFGAFVRDFLADGEGLAMLALDSVDAVADAAEFARAGIGAFRPFSFERSGRQPDGTETRVGFSLAFALDERVPRASFFVCQQHNPQAFWNPELQRHPNGATNITGVTLAVADPAGHGDFVAAYTGVSPRGTSYPLAENGALEVVPAEGPPGSVGPVGFTGFTVAVGDTEPLEVRCGDRPPHDKGLRSLNSRGPKP